MYAIAARFSLAARRNAAAREYTNRYDMDPNRTPRPAVRRTELGDYKSGYCPLGVMVLTALSPRYPAPHSENVARLLTGETIDIVASGYGSAEYYRVADEAFAFTVAWDNGLIDDLADALGLV